MLDEGGGDSVSLPLGLQCGLRGSNRRLLQLSLTRRAAFGKDLSRKSSLQLHQAPADPQTEGARVGSGQERFSSAPVFSSALEGAQEAMLPRRLPAPLYHADNILFALKSCLFKKQAQNVPERDRPP